jgi:hypothetical protein
LLAAHDTTAVTAAGSLVSKPEFIFGPLHTAGRDVVFALRPGLIGLRLSRKSFSHPSVLSASSAKSADANFQSQIFNIFLFPYYQQLSDFFVVE